MIPYASKPDEKHKVEAVEMIPAGLGDVELHIAASYTTPFFWAVRHSDNSEQLKGGSLFFLDTGRRIFGVTAAHVVETCLDDEKSSLFVKCMLGSDGKESLPFKPKERLIDFHPEIDIATLHFSADEINYIGRLALRGSHQNWPPPIPQDERGVICCGFPSRTRPTFASRAAMC